MRLLDTSTLTLIEFTGNPSTISYGILSHTWSTEELSFRDVTEPELMVLAKQKAGYAKVAGACTIALKYGLRYIWIDTCCIDKASSSELSEAINSMYKYYREARICFVYLADVVASRCDPETLKECRWITRGWTLQELLAPRSLTFYNRDWVDIGTKSSLGRWITAATGIPPGVLSGKEPVDSLPVARRMSWAAKRETTREEDMAYCLMGIFGVNMPPLYGEGGRKAFIRLQEEIIRHSYDQSIFAWQLNSTSDTRLSPYAYTGLLAESPAEFSNSGNVTVSNHLYLTTEDWIPEHPYSVTNQGVHIYLPLVSLPQPDDPDVSLGILDCFVTASAEEFYSMHHVCIYLKHVAGQHYRRILPDSLPLAEERAYGITSAMQTEMYVKQQRSLQPFVVVHETSRTACFRHYGFRVFASPFTRQQFNIMLLALPNSTEESEDLDFRLEPLVDIHPPMVVNSAFRVQTILLTQKTTGKVLSVTVGLDFDVIGSSWQVNPWVAVEEHSAISDTVQWQLSWDPSVLVTVTVRTVFSTDPAHYEVEINVVDEKKESGRPVAIDSDL